MGYEKIVLHIATLVLNCIVEVNYSMHGADVTEQVYIFKIFAEPS